MPAYRPVESAKRERYQEILQHAFAIEDGPDREHPEDTEPWPSDLFEPRGLFDGDRLLSVCKLYLPDVVVHGEAVPVGGLGAVATPPQHRRNGYTRSILTHALAEYHEKDVPLVLLWPFSTPFYRNLGWGVANKFTEYELPPEQLSFARDTPGEIHRLEPDDWEQLRPAEREQAAGTNLAMRRSELWWRERTLAAWPGDTAPYIYAYRHDGQVRGYLLYTVTDDSTMRVTDLVAADRQALDGLFDFLSDHDSQAETVLFRRGGEPTLLDRIPDPDVLDCTIQTGPMVRLTDVARPVEAYPWPTDCSVEFTLDVSDPLIERNDGQFSVTVENGDATVSETTAENADLHLDIATLSQLWIGSYSFAEADQYGTLTLTTETLRSPLADAFDGGDVCLREFF